MRKFTKEQIKRLETGGLYLATVEEGMADPKDEDTLLLESVKEKDTEALIQEIREGKAPESVEARAAREKNEALLKECFEKPKEEGTTTVATSQQISELKETFGGKIPDLEEAIPPAELLQETVTIDEILEGDGKPFRFKGRAVKVDRRNKNNRRYGRSITERALKETRSQGQTLTVMDGHPRKGDTAVTPVVGKVVFGDLREDGWLPYEATISDTSRGLDIQKLLKDKCIGDVSLRSKGRCATTKMNGEAIDDVVDLHFRGLDLVTEGSEQDAKVDEIFDAH